MRPLQGVKDLRERRMLSQQELANRAGVSLFTVQRIEREEGSVRPKTGRAIAAALGVSVEDLLGKVQPPLPDFEEERHRTVRLSGSSAGTSSASATLSAEVTRILNDLEAKRITRDEAARQIVNKVYAA